MADAVGDLILDACCLINLYAANEILVPMRRAKRSRRAATPSAKRATPALNSNLHVSNKVMQEALYIRKFDEENKSKLVQTLIDLTPLVEADLLHPCDLQDQAEIELFVELATTLDDGEAVTMAIARTRRWALASDDRKARRLAGQLGVNVVTTPELVKAWADSTSARDADIANVLQNIQTFARFVPHRTMPLHQWWTDMVSKTST